MGRLRPWLVHRLTEHVTATLEGMGSVIIFGVQTRYLVGGLASGHGQLSYSELVLRIGQLNRWFL